ncbi:MAG: hypothetical protein K1X83_05430 [Oligoflexia bacterium]|nr:hypothetical protein [Oligoflexia bacterium]
MILEISLLTMLLGGALLFGMWPGLVMLAGTFAYAASQYHPAAVGLVVLTCAAVTAVPLSAAVCGAALERHTFVHVRRNGQLNALVLATATTAFLQTGLPVSFFTVIERAQLHGKALDYGQAIAGIISAALSVGSFAALLIMGVVLLAEVPLVIAGRIGEFKADHHITLFRPLLVVFVLSMAMNLLLGLFFEELAPLRILPLGNQP